MSIQFTTRILQFNEQGEKTGWTYIKIPCDIALQLKPGNKKSFRVKGKLDDFDFRRIALIPMGGGDFIMALNASIRKSIHKSKGAMLKVLLEIDESPQRINADLMSCLKDEPEALAFFNTLSKGHRNYFSKWIESARTGPTRVKRITQSVNAFLKKQGFSEMLHALRQEKDELGSV